MTDDEWKIDEAKKALKDMNEDLDKLRKAVENGESQAVLKQIWGRAFGRKSRFVNMLPQIWGRDFSGWYSFLSILDDHLNNVGDIVWKEPKSDDGEDDSEERKRLLNKTIDETKDWKKNLEKIMPTS